MKPTEFKQLDVRKILAQGIGPLPEIRKRVAALTSGEGLAVIAPFIPSPLIELLGAQNFAHRVEHDPDGTWTTYFWREQEGADCQLPANHRSK